METKTLVTDEQCDKLTSLRISIATDTQRFHEQVLMMESALHYPESYAKATRYYNEAMKHLSKIEDSIKRFRENRPQEFEED